MRAYRALSELHGDRVYLPGDEVELSEDDARPLLESGDIEPAGGPEPEAPPSLTAAQTAWLRSLTPTHLERLAGFDRDWIDRLIAVANLRAEQVDRLVDLESDGVQALLFPSTPTVEATLAAALKALGNATPDQVLAFAQAVESVAAERRPDPEPTRQDRLIAGIAGLDPKNPDHWLSDGTTPSTKALEAATGLEDVSAAERDAAHTEFVKREGADLIGG